MPVDNEKIGKIIKKARIAKKLTQEQLSEVADITARSISDLENGKRMPRYENLERLVAALDIPRESVFRRKEPELSPEAERFIMTFKSATLTEQRLIIAVSHALLDTLNASEETERDSS